MIDTAIVVGIIRILFVCIIITAAYIISTRNLLSVVSVYALQSLTLVGIALALWSLEGSIILLAIAVVTFISKVIIIPYFIATIQEKIRIKRDIEFHYLKSHHIPAHLHGPDAGHLHGAFKDHAREHRHGRASSSLALCWEYR